jgi:hypothetical protein
MCRLKQSGGAVTEPLTLMVAELPLLNLPVLVSLLATLTEEGAAAASAASTLRAIV